jgi:uncharacterized membrane protein SpoIIM required for sporulation
MIVNLEKFIAEERVHWDRLEVMLDKLANDHWSALSLEEARELERLYQRASADLARLATFSAEPEARRHLENLVARGYAEVHGGQQESARFRPWAWLSQTFPQTFRRRSRAFVFAMVVTLIGAVFGGLAVAFDPEAKEVIMPFGHLLGDPSERVAKEEAQSGDHLDGRKGSFSGELMTHNTQVTLTAMALGMSWGVGTLVLIFYNGVILGAVAVDYVLAGETVFLLGWLLPHGIIEIPAIFVGGQAGFVLAGALLGRGQSQRMAARLRAVMPDVVTLCFGAALMLVWAGIVEAYLSQYHEPVIPYWVKIAFGTIEGVALLWYLLGAGRGAKKEVRA